jgi:RNA polymerase sigma factor (sigma-70 family)
LDPKLKENVATRKVNWDAEKDENLLHCMAHGSAEEQRAAFDAFYRRHSQYFYGICHNVVNRYKVGLCEVDDLFQTTMLKAWQRANTFKMEKFTTNPEEMEHAADAWLGAIAENILMDWLSERPLCISLDLEELERDGVCLAADDLSSGEDSEEARLVRQAIETLSPNEQKVIWTTNQFYRRCEHQRIPTKDLDGIVESLQTSRDNFRKIRERARNKIRAYINNHKSVSPQNEPPRQIRIE